MSGTLSRRARTRPRPIAVALAGVAALLALMFLAALPTQAAGSTTYHFTGAVQDHVIPEGVHEIDVVVKGASGGHFTSGTPGKGARVSARLSVTPRSTLKIYVGAAGSTTYQPATTAFNGGGAGWQGGGASDIRIGGTGLGHRVIVAGGGGGGDVTAGGDGGQDGVAAAGSGGSTGGGGGTQSSGGSAGTGTSGTAGAGAAGQGGDHIGFGAGGGGGGYFGGGGGACSPCTGGGGGSSYVVPSASSITYETGVHTGDGEVTITEIAPIPPDPTPTPTPTPTPQPTGTVTPKPTHKPTPKPTRTPTPSPSQTSQAPFVPADNQPPNDNPGNGTDPQPNPPDSNPDTPNNPDDSNGDGSSNGGAPSKDSTADPAAPYPVFNPLAHAEQLVTETGVAGFSLLAVMAGGLAAAKSRESANVVSAQTDRMRINDDLQAAGDRSGTWRWPAVGLIDSMSVTAPVLLTKYSPILGRVAVDGSYLRAILGTLWLIFPFLGLLGGVAAVVINGGSPLPPPLWLVLIVLALGILDATAGFAAVIAFVVGTAISGGIVDGDAVRILMGVATLWFVIPLIAAFMRPMGRRWGTTREQRFDRIADIVIASLIGGWTAQKVVGGWPGLSGLELPIVEFSGLIALTALAAIIIRMILESVTTTYYPVREAMVTPDEIPDPPRWQELTSVAISVAAFIFISIVFIENCWQLWAGAALLAAQLLIIVYADRLPNSPWLYRHRPKRFVAIVTMMIVGLIAATIFTSIVTDPHDVLVWGFLILSIPGFLFSLLARFGRDGEEPTLTWKRRLLGALVFLIGILLVLR